MNVETRRVFLFAGIVMVVVLIYLLASILIPFLIAALLAYFFHPLVDKMERFYFPRALVVSVIFLGVFVIVLGIIFLFIPILEKQFLALTSQLPKGFEWFNQKVWPLIGGHFDIQDGFNFDYVKTTMLTYMHEGNDITARIWKTISHSGLVLISFVTNVVLIPVVCFYLLCDWKKVTSNIFEWLPLSSRKSIVDLLQECGCVLSAFFRGQLLVMVALSMVYGVGLSLVGLEAGLLIGFLSGLLSIVPYLGFISGLLMAVVASFLQFHEWIYLFFIFMVFFVGSLSESFVLIPWLVGDRIGLHPVVVIFAVLSGGKLFGFFGVLLAIPISAVVVVMLRHIRSYYIRSAYYNQCSLEEGQK